MKKIFKFLIIAIFAFICFLGFKHDTHALDSKIYEGITFQPWEDTTALPTEGNFYLAYDVNLVAPPPSTTRVIATDKQLNLDLNGHTIKHYGNNLNATLCVYYINGGTLSIYDSVGTGLITNCGTCCIWLDAGVFNLYGGKLSGNDFNSSYMNEYGALYVNGSRAAEFNMYGGEITGNGNGNTDIQAYGTLNFYAGHVGIVVVYTANKDKLVSIHGGKSTPLSIDRINPGKILQMTDGKVAAGSKINFEVYGYEENKVVTNGFTSAGYSNSDASIFGTVKASESSSLLDCVCVDNEIQLVEPIPEHTAAHAVDHFDEIPATCLEDGVHEYYHCTVCFRYYLDAEYTQEVSQEDLIISALGHDMTHHDAVSPSCTMAGETEHWTCSHESGVFYGNEEATITLDSILISALGHDMTHHDAVKATCLEDGTLEYWTCSRENGIYFANEDGTQTLDSIVDAKTGHINGQPEYTWNEDHTECVATIHCTKCHEEIDTENGTVTFSENGKKVTATFTHSQYESQTLDLGSTDPDDPTESTKCAMHWILIVLTIVYLAFYICWYTILKEKEIKFLPAKIAKKLFPLFVSGLMLILVLIFGIIGLSKACTACTIFFIVDILLIGIAVALYFFDEVIFGFFKKSSNKENNNEK